MTAKTTRGRDVSDDARAEATSAAEPPVEELGEREEAAEVEAEPATARVAPKKRVRRVRVIEVVDDEDDGLEEEELEELLEALDEDEAAPKPARKAPAAQAAKPKAASRPAVTTPAETSAETSAETEAAETEAAETEAVAADPAAADPAEAGKTGAGKTEAVKAGVAMVKAKAAAGSTERASGVRTVLGSSALTKALVALLVVALGALSVWQWRQAATLSADKDARQEVATAAGAYGNVFFTFAPATAQQNISDNLRLLSGDLAATFKQTTAVTLPEFFKKNPGMSMTSKIEQVFVGDVNGRLATAVILVDVAIKTDKGPVDAPDIMVRLALKKEKGGWKVTEQKFDGDAGGSGAGQLQLPSGSTGTTSGTLPGSAPSPSQTAKP